MTWAVSAEQAEAQLTMMLRCLAKIAALPPFVPVRVPQDRTLLIRHLGRPPRLVPWLSLKEA